MRSTVARGTEQAARWSAIALGFSIPLTIVLNNVLLGLTLLAWISAGRFKESASAFQHRASLAALILFAIISAGVLYGEASIGSAALHLRKYLDLLLIPVFLHVFRDDSARHTAIIGLALSLGCILFLSYLLMLGVPLGIPAIRGSMEYPVVFKHHLTHNILMAFAVYFFAWLAMTGTNRYWQRWVWAICAVLAFGNVTAMVSGATGYLILGALLLFLGYRRIGWRGLGIAFLLSALIGTALLLTKNPFEQRVIRVVREIQEWRPDVSATTSTGWRLEFYRNTLLLIADHPVTGVGTGGFASAYAKKVEGTGKVATTNPHNEFLLMWAQLGIAGLVVFIWMFWRQWQLAAQLPTRLESELARGLVVTMVIGCMLNSLLLDHTEGLFYAWLTGVLYGGLKSGTPDGAAQSASRTPSASSVR